MSHVTDRQSLFALDGRSDIGLQASRLDQAWQRFVDHQEKDPFVRALVWESWKRCSGQGLNPLDNRSPRCLSDSEVRDYVDRDPVFAEIDLVTAQLSAAANDSAHLLVCCSAAGHVMHLAGDSSVRRKADHMNLVVGSHWAEDKAGTNAIGTAIVKGAPVQLFGSEHYVQAVHPWTSSAAPICDPATDEVLAVIDMTGVREAYHPHTLAAVITGARLVEERLRGKLEMQRFRLLDVYTDHTSRLPDAPIATLDRGLRVVKASPAFYRDGWIRDDGRLAPRSDIKLWGKSESRWEAQGKAGRVSFVMTPHIEGGQQIGALVRMVQQGVHANAVSVGGERRPRANGSDISHSFESLIGNAPPFRAALATARSAGSDVPVLIEGDTGTGKELIAQAIHCASNRATKPFVAVNCGAMSRELATSEFFGYEGGAFTGAVREGRAGKFEQANGGTLFLDEIGDLPLELQAVMLRVLEEQRVVRVGGQKSVVVNVRIIAATNQDLLSATERGAFRRDLYYRLSVLKILMPALRDRPEDIEVLVNQHCIKAYGRAGLPAPRIDPEVFRILKAHPWQGNIRELRNLVDRLAIEVRGPIVYPQDLPTEFITRRRQAADGQPRDSTSLKAQELGTIHSTLVDCTGNVTEAARRLGINRSTIYRKLGRFPASN